MDIERRTLGASGLIVPALGIGTMSWGEHLMGYGKTHTHQDVNEAYRACLDAGLTFFDSDGTCVSPAFDLSSGSNPASGLAAIPTSSPAYLDRL